MADTTGNLTARATSGAVWLASQTVVSRVTSLLSQLVLAWLLAPEDFGQIALVYTITSFATQITNPGIDDVLLQKQKHLRRWITPACWMSLMCGVLGMVFMILGGVLVVSIARHHGNAAYGNINLLWMIVILAFAAPITTAGMVPMVVLRARMRFARIAGIGLGEVVAQQVLAVLFAAMRFGAYSFVLPVPIIAAAKTLVLWLMVRPPIRMHLALHRWPALTSSTGWVFGYRLLAVATAVGDYITLGAIWGDDAMDGRYYFAFMLAMQVVRVLGDNAAAVLLPALNALQDDLERMKQAVRRASGAMAAVIIPALTLQILLAGPVVRVLFAAKWEPAIPLVRWLSAGWLLYSAATPMGVMVVARGKFRVGFFLWLLNVITFFALVIPFTWFGRDRGTAIAVGIWWWLTALLLAIVAFESPRGVWMLLDAVSRPLAAAGGAVVPAALVVWLMPHTRWSDVLTVATVTPIVLMVYLTILRYLDRAAVDMLAHQLASVLRPILRFLFARRVALAA
jgi:PST family polysaccharide transporter